VFELEIVKSEGVAGYPGLLSLFFFTKHLLSNILVMYHLLRRRLFVDYCNDSKSHRKVLVIGDIMLDQYVIGKARRLCPEDPEPVLEAVETRCFPGGAANVAVNIKNMGGQVILAGLIGKDEEGDLLRKLLNQKNIPALLGVDAGRPTTVKKRIGTSEQLFVRLDREREGGIPKGIFHDILKVVAVILEDVGVVIISDYGKGVVTRELIAAVSVTCKARNIPIYVNPIGSDFSRYRQTDVLKPSFHTMEILYGSEIRKAGDLEKAAEVVFAVTNCKACIVTWGSNGVILFRSPGDWIHYPCQKTWDTVYDPGTEDVFLAGLAMAAIKGLSLKAACMEFHVTASAAAPITPC
jgi:rfaE bifunctional protein kinase chain/domain